MPYVTANLRIVLDVTGKSGLDSTLSDGFKKIGVALGLPLTLRTEGMEALRTSYSQGIVAIGKRIGIELRIDTSGMFGFQNNVLENLKRIDAAIGSPINPATVSNIDETSTLNVSQVAGAVALLAEMDAIFAAIDAANDQSEIQLAGLDSRLDAMEN